MASNSPPDARKPGFLARFGLSSKRWASTHVAPSKDIDQSSTYLYGAGTTTVASLLGHGSRGARARQIIYEKWMRMEGDPIISSALQLLVTSALGGHETSGDLVFIEKTVEAKKDKRLSAIVDEIYADLAPLFNRVAFQMAYTGAAYGDAYARIYADARGVVDLHCDEMIRPQLVQPFERGSRTVGFAVSVGERNFQRLDVSQLARLKMPRTQWIPQFGVVEKSLKVALTENDIDKLPIMPSMIGGSLLYNAEEPYDNLSASLLGLVGQRWMDSIDEQMVTVNVDSMTKEQQERFLKSVAQMLKKSKDYAEKAVQSGRPIMERIRHIIPVFNEKQLTTVGPANGGQPGRAATISIEDVLLHARLLSGAMGVDLSMLGFADQLSGGLGEGGFFRVSAQAAERARIIRVALEQFFNHVIDIHTYRRYGVVFNHRERPWEINFFGSISALEAEKQRTRTDSMNSGMLLVQTMQMMKDMGASKDVMTEFLAKQMMLDEDQARLYAAIVEAKPAQDGGGMGGGGFGGGEMDSAHHAVAFDSAPETSLGPVFTEYENDPEGAIERLMRERTGDARAVWKRQGLGTIDLVWGGPKFGLMHIARKHAAALRKLPGVLKHGRIVRFKGNNKIHLVDDKEPLHVVVVSLDYFGTAKTWVVTSYDDEKGKIKELLASIDPDQLDSLGGTVAQENLNIPFAGSLKTIDTEALDSAAVEVLTANQRTRGTLTQSGDGFNL